MAVSLKIMLLFYGVFAASPSHAAGLVAALAQQSSHTGLEQMALVFHEGKPTEWTSNSNFLFPSTSVVLGRAQLPVNPEWKTRSEHGLRLEGAAKEASVPASRYLKNNPHGIQYIFATHTVTIGSPVQKWMLEALRWAAFDPQLKIQDGVRITRDAQGKVKAVVEGKSAKPNAAALTVKCVPYDTQTDRCDVPQWGTAYLSRKK